jgi:hypothetical protein
MIRLRLQAGPHDGERRRVPDHFVLPNRIYVVRCRQCGSHWYGAPAEGAEVYRHDEERDGCVVYVWTDLSLTGPSTIDEREKVPAGGWA